MKKRPELFVTNCAAHALCGVISFCALNNCMSSIQEEYTPARLARHCKSQRNIGRKSVVKNKFFHSCISELRSVLVDMNFGDALYHRLYSLSVVCCTLHSVCNKCG